MNNNPHPLSRQLGEELSQWLDQEFLEEIFDYMLDLSFIVKENKEELADIYEAYNGL